ncbi:MAG TPA: hypothetical protein VGK47_01495 [Nitrososphaeraceae archaeon]|jgi:hypothetical protein
MISIIAAIIIITAKSCTIKSDGDKEDDKPGSEKICGKEELATSGGVWFIKIG